MKTGASHRKKETPTRYRHVKETAKLGPLSRQIARDYGLPAGSVRLVLPSGRKAPVSSNVRRLWRNWKA